MSADSRPCKGANTNICVGEGCYGESCIRPAIRARDLPATKHWQGGVITWTHNGVTYKSRPYAIEHAAGYTYLHIEGWRDHQLKGEWEVEVSP